MGSRVSCHSQITAVCFCLAQQAVMLPIPYVHQKHLYFVGSAALCACVCLCQCVFVCVLSRGSSGVCVCRVGTPLAH